MRRLPLQLALAALALPAAAQTASFQGLGDLPGGNFFSLAYDVSADGAVVVGRSQIAASGSIAYEAFQWTADGGMVGLGYLPGGANTHGSSEAFGASADGSVIVGSSGAAAFRWTAGGGMVSLGLLPGTNNSGARSVSADGSVVVGSSGAAAFRWTADGGMSRFSPGFGNSSGSGVSADGSVFAGSVCSTWTCYAFRWTAEIGMVNLDIPRDISSVEAYDVSADGGTIVGYVRGNSGGREAFRWTAEGGMLGLGRLPDFSYSEAYGTSADGAVVVGRNTRRGAGEAFLWTAGEGMQQISALLTSAGVNVSGWTLLEAWGVSDDGTVIVGYGRNPQGQTEAWRAVLPRAVSADPSPEAGPGFGVTVSPNPVRNRATLRFRLPEAGPVRLALVDALGRTVAVVTEGGRGAGDHTVAVDTSRLPAGVYVARLDAGAQTITKRLTVVR